jgi:hypothetical protein
MPTKSPPPRCGRSFSGGSGETHTTVYAVSAPAELSLMCGTRYARPSVRVERWDREPGPLTGSWEVFDEIPFLERTDRGPLVVLGFHPP